MNRSGGSAVQNRTGRRSGAFEVVQVQVSNIPSAVYSLERLLRSESATCFSPRLFGSDPHDAALKEQFS